MPGNSVQLPAAPYPLAHITTHGQFLLVEHFIEFKNPQNKYEMPFAAQTFNEVIEPKPNGSARRGFGPEALGLIVVDRSEIGLPPRPDSNRYISSQKALQVGSFIDFTGELQAGNLPPLPRIGPKKSIFLYSLSDRLIKQIGT